MMNFYEAPAIVRTLLAISFFLLSIHMLAILQYGIYAKVKKQKLVTIIVLTIIPWIVFYCMRLAMIWAGEESTRLEFEKWMLDIIPVSLWFVLLVVLIVFDITTYRTIKKWRKNSISSLTLKEAMDTLPAGLCFYTKNGQILMMNYKFQQLCKEITGEFIVNMLDFKKALEMQCIDISRQGFIWHSKDHHVWNFEFHTLEEGIYQMISHDVTEIWKLNEDIQSQNTHIQQMNERLKEYNRNVEQVVKEDELLAARIKLHDDMGRILLMTKRYLATNCLEESTLYQQWHNMLTLLRNEKSLRIENDPLTELEKAASSLGLHIIVKGEFPTSGKELKLLMSGARECMTNAAHHYATTMEIEMLEFDTYTSITYKNNGEEPDYPVYLGGGLSSLKRMIEKEGATFEIAAHAPFYIQISIPKRKGKE